MIKFNCPQCEKLYSVGDDLAGRSAKCKACGAKILVPEPEPTEPAEEDISDWLGDIDAMGQTSGDLFGAAVSEPAASAPHTAKKNPNKKKKPPMRTRRLIADANLLVTSFRNFPTIQIKSRAGNPPDIYRIVYNIRGLERGPEGKPVYRSVHEAEIQLTSNYPRQSPKCRMITPIFHPNIEPTTICVGDHWTAGERLVDLVVRIGEMIAYQAYNIKSPLDGDAAMWAESNTQHLPVDTRDLRPPNLE